MGESVFAFEDLEQDTCDFKNNLFLKDSECARERGLSGQPAAKPNNTNARIVLSDQRTFLDESLDPVSAVLISQRDGDLPSSCTCCKVYPCRSHRL